MNLTSMLVLVTMFISVSNNLPKTSYMKMIDVWLLFNLLYPFVIVLVHTRMDSLRENEDEGEFDNTMPEPAIKVILLTIVKQMFRLI